MQLEATQMWLLEQDKEHTSFDFTSTSTSKEEAQKYAKDDQDVVVGTYVDIVDACGVDVRDLSIYQRENEILLVPPTYFKVDSFYKPDAKREANTHVTIRHATFARELLSDTPSQLRGQVQLFGFRPDAVVINPWQIRVSWDLTDHQGTRVRVFRGALSTENG